MARDFWTNRNVFVTGATGFLGPWLVKELKNSGANVTALERDFIPNSNFYLFGLDKRVNLIKGDLTDYQLLLRCLNEFEIDTVIHLGAQAIVSIANHNPLSTFESNIRGTWNLLEAVRNSKSISRVVVASSDKAYGTHKILPYTEDMQLQGKYPYDASKVCVDILAQSYISTYNLPIVITRCGNFYGGGDLNFNRLVPGTIKSVIEDQIPIIRSDGLFIRDYIYVADAVSAYMTCAEKADLPNVRGQAFNFSTEKYHSVIDVVNLILKLSKSDLKPKILNQASNEIREQYLSSKKAETVLDWQAKYTLDEGLTNTINWYRTFLNKNETIPGS